MDKDLNPLVVIATGEISSLRSEPSRGDWVLAVRWSDHKAEITYRGIFAERFARLAEESLRQANLSDQPRPGKHRAAGA